MYQVSYWVDDTLHAPALRAAIMSSLSVISPPAITGIVVDCENCLMTLGISPGRISIASGLYSLIALNPDSIERESR